MKPSHARPSITRMLSIAALPLLIACSAGSVNGDRNREWPMGNADTMWEDRYRVGSYRHLDEILPTRTVRAAADPFPILLVQ